jgi:hypothetical protein
MNVLELFAGSRSFSKVCERRGHNVFTSDYKDFDNIDYVVDILNFDTSKVPFVPDIIWASPPCTYFSVASIGKHWYKDNTPKSSNAVLGMNIVKETLEIIKYFHKKNPNLKYYIENPRGKLRKLYFMQEYIRQTVTYCQYGDNRMKPTDIWTNDAEWSPRKMCKNGDSCHVSAPRGSATGTQGLKGNYLRSVVPSELCEEIISINENNK